VQDYTLTSFNDESFSLIWACESMCHAQEKIKFYNEAYRLLKPGGRLICADYFRTGRPLPEEGEKLLHAWLNGWSIKDIDTFDEHKENAALAGFTHFEKENITEYTKPSLKHLHSMASKLWQFGRFLRQIGLRNNINHGNHFSSIKQFEALENNLWQYGLISVKKSEK
jgi:SAM-dependent methyltransferase